MSDALTADELLSLEAAFRHSAAAHRGHGDLLAADACVDAADILAGKRALMESARRMPSAEWLPTAAAAERLGLTRGHVERLCREKGFGRRRGGRWEADITALRAYLGKP